MADLFVIALDLTDILWLVDARLQFRARGTPGSNPHNGHRTDLIGHATILAALLLVAAGVGGGGAEQYTAPLRLSRALLRVPAGLAVALVAFLLSYNSIHHVIYRDGHPAWLGTEVSNDTIRPGGTLPPHAHFFSEEDDDNTSDVFARRGFLPVRSK